jgi:hypothetical protein
VITALAVAATVPTAGVILFLVLPRMERWLDDAEEPTSARREVGPSPTRGQH